MNYFTSDLHLSHRAIPKYREPFGSMKEHDDYMFSKIMELGKRDVLFVLGDFLFDGPHYEEYIERLSEKKCRIKLLMGNHDSLKLYQENIVEVQLPLFSYKNMWLSHCPIHPQELRRRLGNIHGHLHSEVVPDPLFYNVNVDVNDYEFVKFEDIKRHFTETHNRIQEEKISKNVPKDVYIGSTVLYNNNI